VAEHKPAPDQPQRDAAIRERRRNVLIDAGAGTGKTTILVERLVEMVAPTTGAPAIPIGRLAAITFTRKAAGELRLRIRERLLAALAEPALPASAPAAERERRLREAVADLDTAYVGTIHSFADRLLRLRPVEAELSPAYDIADDADDLVREKWDVLLHAVQSDTLPAELAGTTAADRAAEAAATIRLALTAGLRAASFEREWKTDFGLDDLVSGFIRWRDVPPDDASGAAFGPGAFRAAAGDFAAAARPVSGDSAGARWIRQTARMLERLRACDDPIVLFRHLRSATQRRPRALTKRDGFGGDGVAWKAAQKIGMLKPHDPGILRELHAPLDRWMATRLVRLFPVAVALYEKVKARRQALDQLDLLVKLRGLLERDREVRREFQGLFDHVFVDEFQDTDPLQAEIVLFLCEREPRADRWDGVVLRDGALTLVGDPKQSIYRFRRADVAMYDHVRQVVARGAHLHVTLAANFRSVPSLVQWMNDRFERVLGSPPDGRPFDPATGTVFHQPLAPGRTGAARRPVHVLSVEFPDARKHDADAYRALEGQALARYLRWLVEASDVRIEDPLERRPRRVRHGDIAVLAVSTWRLSLLFPWLDAEGIPYASRGGTLFLSDPLNRQFLLGLRALADRDDGVAEAALLRPPFFALDPADLLRERAAASGGLPEDDAVLRVREARELVRSLRQPRLARPPGATARDLLDRTAIARVVALGPNGAQRLSRLRELCLVLEHTAARDGLDFDGVTARMRRWATDPIQLDPPPPVGDEAVQVLTVHQAKGLEFPVVVLWDGRGQWDTRLPDEPWRMERDGRGWTMSLDGLAWEEPAGLTLRQTERRYLDAERRRVIYVAATRARDLLVIPRTGEARPGKLVCSDLLDGADASLMVEMAPYRGGRGASWAGGARAPEAATPADGERVAREIAGRWGAAAAESARPRFTPVSVSGEARRALAEDETEGDPAARKPRAGRFGHVFGSVVHAAIGLLLREPALGAPAAVRKAAAVVGLTEHLDEAVADVGRAWQALEAAGLARTLGPDLQVEYPVAAPWDGGALLMGYIDLIGATAGGLDVLDFKTDAPPAGAVEDSYPEYASQVRLYGGLLEAAGAVGDRRLRCGLLFTADGAIRWVS
jgi:ATP-dependent helicase/nuclease subunit A